MANLVLCFDGTWNNMLQEDNGEIATTNVAKFYHSLSESDGLGNKQLKFYHPGLGGENTGLYDKIVDGALGKNIGEHICNGYKWLSDNYADGDNIIIIGFSRGAFSARSLAGMMALGLLDKSGLTSEDIWARVNEVYKQYKTSSLSMVDSQWLLAGSNEIAFLGVWDTVGALGVPNELGITNLLDKSDKWRFHDTALGKHVKVARHAMAMDEKRSNFTVTKWTDIDASSDVKQLWFIGVHSDVGGGYSDSSLSDIALRWMIDEAKMSVSNVQFRSEVQVTGKPCGVMHNSYKGIFSKLRSRPRNVDEVSVNNAHLFHPSVFERQAISPIDYPLYWPSKRLEIGESAEFDVFAKQRWNPSYLFLAENEEYTFSSSGKWVDKTDVCDWKGTERGDYSVGDAVRSVLSFVGRFEKLFNKKKSESKYDVPYTKRIEPFSWFSAVGCISNDNNVADAVENDGSPSPHQYAELFKHEHNALQVKASGYLYMFANDAWIMYKNNKGAIKIKVERVS